MRGRAEADVVGVEPVRVVMLRPHPRARERRDFIVLVTALAEVVHCESIQRFHLFIRRRRYESTPDQFIKRRPGFDRETVRRDVRHFQPLRLFEICAQYSNGWSEKPKIRSIEKLSNPAARARSRTASASSAECERFIAFRSSAKYD